jgi:hypothetical protein
VQQVADEGAGVMHFKAQQAKKHGEDHFKLGDKEFPVDESDMEEGNLFTKGLEDDDVAIGDTIPGTNAIKTKDIDEAEVDVDEPVEEPVNGPKPEYKTMRQSTLNPGEADNGEKAMHGDKPTFKNGDNPLTRPTLEARLAAEYESIKKVS